MSQTFAQLPADCRVILLCPDDTGEWKFVRGAISYLTWPRKIYMVKLGPTENFAGNISESDVVLFGGLPVTPDPNRTQTTIAPKLVMLGPTISK